MTLRALIVSIILHVVLLGLLVLSFDFSKKELVIQPQDVMQAVSVDSAQVEKEISALKQRDKEKELAEKKLEQKLEELEAKARAAEQKRTQKEKELTELEKKTETEKQEAEAAEKKLAEINKQKEAIKKQEQQAEMERQENAAREAKEKKLAEEKKHKDAEQKKKDQGVVNEHVARIARAVQEKYILNIGEFDDLNLVCILRIRMTPGGEVLNVALTRSSGNTAFDERAKSAVYGASPLPVPKDPKLFEETFREIDFKFDPQLRPRGKQ